MADIGESDRPPPPQEVEGTTPNGTETFEEAIISDDANHNGGRSGEEGGEEDKSWWGPRWVPKEVRGLLPFLGGVAAVGVAVALGSTVHKHVVSGDKGKVKRDKVTGETLVTDPEMAVTVQKGDTLYSIAKNCKVTVSELRAANNLRGDTVPAGAKLLVPAVVEPGDVQELVDAN